MFEAELSTRAATILSNAAAELRTLALEAARAVSEIHNLGGDVNLVLEDGLRAFVNGKIGAVTLEGQAVSTVEELHRIIVALRKELGRPVTSVEAVVKAVEEEAVKVEQSVATSLETAFNIA